MTAALVMWTVGKPENHARLMWVCAAFDLLFSHPGDSQDVGDRVRSASVRSYWL